MQGYDPHLAFYKAPSFCFGVSPASGCVGLALTPPPPGAAPSPRAGRCPGPNQLKQGRRPLAADGGLGACRDAAVLRSPLELCSHPRARRQDPLRCRGNPRQATTRDLPGMRVGGEAGRDAPSRSWRGSEPTPSPALAQCPGGWAAWRLKFEEIKTSFREA